LLVVYGNETLDVSSADLLAFTVEHLSLLAVNTFCSGPKDIGLCKDHTLAGV